MRLLVTGAGGQLGRELVSSSTASGDEVLALDRDRLDITSRDEVLGLVTSWRPHAVVNCAAWTAVDACEDDPDRAFLVNGLAVRWLVEACDRAGAHLVQLSTDYVFDGVLDRPYHEWDAPNPQSAYGRSKLAGELEARALGSSATVVRTSWVAGAHGANMVKTITRLAAERSRLAFVDDQRGCPTFTTDLAPVLRCLALDRRGGTYHVTNQRAVTWFEFAREVVAAIGRDPAMVDPITTKDLDPPRPAARPANSVLDNAALRLAGLPPLRDFGAPLRELVSALGAA